MIARSADEVVPFSAVAATMAHQVAMDSAAVDDAFAERASKCLLKDGHPKPSLHHRFAQCGLDIVVRGCARQCVEALAGSIHAGELEVRKAAGVVLSSQLMFAQTVAVDGGRQLPLPWRFIKRACELVSSRDFVVVVVKGDGGGRVWARYLPHMLGVELAT